MNEQKVKSPFPPFHYRRTDQPPMAIEESEFRREFRESKHVEWKEGMGADRIQQAVVAFSNSEGGVIQIGVRNDGTIAGRTLDENSEFRLHQLIGNVRNPGRYSLHELVVGSKSVIVLSVERRHEGFAQLPNGHILVRKGKSNLGLFGQEMVDFISNRALTRFETSELPVPLNDAGLELVSRMASAFGWSNDEEWHERLIELGLAARGHGASPVLTVAGGLYLLQKPPHELSKAYIEIFRYAKAGDEAYDKRLEIAGPLHDQVERATAAIMDELGVDQVVIGAFRHELPKLPAVVVREAIANAVAHRSYEASRTPIRVSIYPDEVVVRSPGGFPEPVTPSNIRDTNASRNPAIIRVLRMMGLAEDAGLGVDRMQDTMRAEMLEPPEFRESDSAAVEVVLRLTGTVAPRERAWVREVERRGDIQPADRVLLVHAARGKVLTNARARELLNVDSVEARQVLQRLRDAGFLRQTGERGSSQYFLVSGLAPPAGLRLTREELKQVIIDSAEAGPISNASVRETTGLSREEVKLLLRELVADERLVLIGEGRGVRYVLAAAGTTPQLAFDAKRQ